MAQLAGGVETDALRFEFDRRLKLEFHGRMAAFGVSGSNGAGLKRLSLPHPPLEERIAVMASTNQERARSR